MKPEITLSKDLINDVYNIVNGAYKPLSGFLRKDDFRSVLGKMRLASGALWSVPIVIDISEEEKNRIKKENGVLLRDELGNKVAVLKNQEIYKNDKAYFAANLFGTLDQKHPGVDDVFKMKDYLLGGEIELMGEGSQKDCLTPDETRRLFLKKRWNTIVAFQTRNAPHRSHEYLHGTALNEVDALFIQPVVGKKKKGDLNDEAITGAYKLILDKYYPRGRVHFDILPLKMRYAGPREAIFHAQIRKNYGCTHMIVGRDHAGVAGFYDPYAAQEIFTHGIENEIGIKILKLDNAFYCRKCASLTDSSRCSHGDKDKEILSGTVIREMIRHKKNISENLMRREVSEYLINHPNPFVE